MLSKKITIVVNTKTSVITSPIKEDHYYTLTNRFTYTKDYEGKKETIVMFGESSFSPKFFTGLLPQIVDILRKKGYKITIEDKRKKVTFDPAYVKKKLAWMDHRIKLKKKSKKGFWPHQLEGINLGLLNCHGVFQEPTGSGKGIHFGALAKLYNLKTLILVDSVDLMKQIANELTIFIPKKKIGMWGAGVKRLRQFTVGIVDTLVNHPKISKWAEYIICDEAHLAAAKTFRDVIFASNAYVRHGFTGTYTRWNAKELDLLYAVTGPKLHEVSRSELIRNGVNAQTCLRMVQLPRGHSLPESRLNRMSRGEMMNRFVYFNKLRNNLACIFTKYHYEKGRTGMLFVSRLNHGKKLYDMLVHDYGIDQSDVVFVHGGSGEYARENSVDNLRSGDVPIVICSKIFEKGIDIPALGFGVNLKGEMSYSGSVQTAGRGARTGGRKFYYLDFFDAATSRTKVYSKARWLSMVCEDQIEKFAKMLSLERFYRIYGKHQKVYQ